MSQSIDTVSSVGAVWPPIVSSNERLKGFYDNPVVTEGSLDTFINDFTSYIAKAEDGAETSRLSIRLVANSGALAVLNSAGINVEGALPIRGQDELLMVYTAWNSHERTVPDTTLEQHGQLLGNIAANATAGFDAVAKLTEQGFSPQVVDRTTSTITKQSLIPKFTELYSVFGYDEADVETIFNNPNNTVAYVEDAEGIVSTVMAERAIIPLEDFGNLEVVEITEAITRPSARGRGLYAGVSGFLTGSIMADSGNLPHIIYGESNLAAPGVLKAAHSNGRRFNHLDASTHNHKALGFGILQQSFKVEDGTEQRAFNDFALTYIPLD
ncbi:MAG: hypothetical protein ABIQ89_01120 [Candidatus Saccharimonadales bacterium]